MTTRIFFQPRSQIVIKIVYNFFDGVFTLDPGIHMTCNLCNKQRTPGATHQIATHLALCRRLGTVLAI